MSAALPAVVVMGVSGCGKSTVGGALAERLRGDFVDADQLHSPEAVAKMASGTALTDVDRAPWLARVGASIAAASAQRPVVVACSALKVRYRDAIRAGAGRPVHFVHLTGSPELLGDRMCARPGHFMPPALLASQLDALEALTPEERGCVIDIDAPADLIVEAAVRSIEESASWLRAGV